MSRASQVLLTATTLASALLLAGRPAGEAPASNARCVCAPTAYAVGEGDTGAGLTSRRLKEFAYGRDNAGEDLRKGKLVQAKRYNWVDPVQPIFAPGGALVGKVVDRYVYAGRGGRVSERQTRFQLVTTTNAWTTGFAYDELGNVSQIDYPRCLHYPCAGTDPARAVTFEYERGFLASIPTFATRIGYQADGMLQSIQHSNGVKEIVEQDADGLSRPMNIRTQGVLNAQGALMAASFLIPGPEDLALGIVARSPIGRSLASRIGGFLGKVLRRTDKAKDVTTRTAQLQARADQVHEVLDPIAQAQRTTAALDTNAGRVIAGGARDLTPAQRAALGPGEIAAKQPGAHAEVTAIAHAQEAGLAPELLAVTRAICPECAAAIEAVGGVLTSAKTAVFP